MALMTTHAENAEWFVRQILGDLAYALGTQELQAISRGIHPVILSTGGLPAALRALARRSSVPVELDVVIEHRLADSIEVAAYYVVAEALTNAAKHAMASVVQIRARTTGDSLDLSISDDGIGGADSGKGSGLIGLKDRIEVLAGGYRSTVRPEAGRSFSSPSHMKHADNNFGSSASGSAHWAAVRRRG